MSSDIETWLAEVGKRAEAATEGPWDTLAGQTVRAIAGDLAVPIFDSRVPVDAHRKKRITHNVLCRAYADEVNNATFIAHARTDIPRLVAELRKTRAALERADHTLSHFAALQIGESNRTLVELTRRAIGKALEGGDE